MYVVYNGKNLISDNDTLESIEGKMNKNLVYPKNTDFYFLNDIKNFKETNDFFKIKLINKSDVFPPGLSKYNQMLVTDSTSG
jgi:hypothetical protein